MRVTIDLMKKSTQIIDLSNVINPRVGDDDLLLPLHICYGDNLYDMRENDVEFLTQDTNKNNIYIAGTCNTNTPGDNLYTGDLTFRFPAGTFKVDGTYDPDQTMFRIVDKATQKVISSVNVKITVMKNAIEFNFDPDKSSYDSRAETMLQDFHDKGQAMLDEITGLNNQAKSNVSGDTAATANEAKKQADQNAGDISDLKGEVAGARGRFADLPGREDAQDTAISQKETIVNANANYAALQQKDAQQDAALNQKAGKFELEDKLAQMNLQPEAFENEAALKAKYPNGKSGLMVTADTGHKWIWVDNSWKDSGTYQAVGLPDDELKVINNALHGETIVRDEAAGEPPYNDLNSLEDNTIVTYAIDITKISHAPENLIVGSTWGATVITMNYASNSDGAGRVQFLITNNADQFVRVQWGSPITWSEWKSSIIRSYPIIQDIQNAKAPFDNLDTIPANSLILYAKPINDLQGSPDKSLVRQHTGAAVLTIGSHLTGYNAGTIQLLFLDNGQTFTRMIWGKPAKYTEWNRPLEKRDLAGIMALSEDLKEGRYNDLNKLPVNTTVSYSLSDEETSLIANYPSKVPGTVRTISCGLSDTPGQFQICVDRNNTIYHRILWGDPSNWTPWESEPTETEKIKPSISLFQNVGIIGDSYASGELYVDGKYIDHYDISWGQILARKNGIKAINFSKGGLTTRDWLADDHGLSLLNSNDPQDLYLIALGINDYSKLGDAYLGAENDINTQADTFYGNYGKIITAIRAKAPQAKIVLSIMSYDSQGTAHNYNEAIKTIAKHFGLPFIEQNSDPLFTSDLYLNHMVGGHPTAPVYAAMANAFQRLIEESMIDNLDYFLTYKQ